MIPNLAWSVLNIGPLFVFCYGYSNLPFVLVTAIISVAAMFIPRSILDRFLNAAPPAFYQRLGVPWLNRFTQNGVLINRLVRKKYPGYKAVFKNRQSLRKLRAQTYMQERFHFGMLLFFLAAGIYAGYTGHWAWFFILVLANILYNVYPILLQHYTRLKLKKVTRE